MNNRKYLIRESYILQALIVVTVLVGSHSYGDSHQPTNVITGFNPLRIAHAGGGIKNKTYTNSYEALNSSYKKGFLYFELDFVFTKDGKLVCLHDWGTDFKRSFGFETDIKVTLKEFKHLVKDKSEFTKCTLDGLAMWMKVNPLAHIITDVKEDNIKALNIIYKTLPKAQRRVIPQIYNPQNFDAIKKVGFEKIIWTLYRFEGDNNKVLEWINNFRGPIAITMPKNRAESTLPKKLAKSHVPSYVHTVNTTQGLDKFTTIFGITEIYTDFLSP